MEITENQNKAVNEIVEMIVTVVGKGSREIDTTEAISSTARLAGSFLFRSFNFNINDAKPGTAMLSEEANTEGPQLVNITHAVLQKFGVQIDDRKMSSGNNKQAESNFVDVMATVQNPALTIMEKNSLSYEQMAQSTAIATAFIIQQSTNITPEEGFGTAIYHYIEGTKTFPPEFINKTNTANTENVENTENVQKEEKEEKDKATIIEKEIITPKVKSKPWWKFW